MARKYTLKYRRRREGKTDYRKRLKLLLSKKPRLVIRKTNKYIIAQIISYHPDGDRVVVQAHSNELSSFGWKLSKKNLPAAYLVGLLIAKKAKGKVSEVVVDIGLYPPIHGSRVFAVVKGALDGGLNINVSEEALPSMERIKGEHIAKYASEHPERFKNEAKQITSMFEQVKQNIEGYNG